MVEEFCAGAVLGALIGLPLFTLRGTIAAIAVQLGASATAIALLGGLERVSIAIQTTTTMVTTQPEVAVGFIGGLLYAFALKVLLAPPPD